MNPPSMILSFSESSPSALLAPSFNYKELRGLSLTSHFSYLISSICSNMYSSKPNSYEKFTETTDTSPPTGIPVSSSNPYFSHPSHDHDHHDSDSQMPAPPPYPPRPRAPEPWKSGLFDCFSDPKNCCTTFWCPCITFGQIAEIVDKGSTSCGASGALYTLIFCVTGCPCFYSCFYRSKMRQQYTLDESPCGDCLVHCFCEYCALCQEYRELRTRGFDMAIGWHGNIEERNREVAMTPVPPVVEEGMSRDK